MLLKLLTFFILRKARNFQSLGRGQAFLSLRLGFVVPRHNFRPEGRLELFLALRPGFFVLRESKKISTPKDKFFTLPKDKKAWPKCEKNFQPPRRTKLIPRDNKAQPEGPKNACTLPRDTIFFSFLEMTKEIKLLEAEKNCKRICQGRKCAWNGSKKT